MAGNKYMAPDPATGIAKVEIAVQTSAGAADAGKLPGLNAEGLIDESMLPTVDVITMTASEALAAGDFVNVWLDSGTPKVRKATAASPIKPATGYVKASATVGASVKVYFEGTNSVLSALTVGSDYFLSDATPGTATTTPPSASGSLVQKVGRAISATALTFEPDERWVNA